jgi:hypothetical protein
MAKLQVQESNTVIDNAFHGTELAVAKRLANGESFKVSTGLDQYLGQGVYFYEVSLEQAESWVNRKRYEEYGILQATVKLGRCLDLNTPEHRKILQYVAAALEKKVGSSEEVTDAAVIEYYASEMEKRLETVRYAFSQDTKSGPIYRNSRFSAREMILCVRKLQNIRKVDLVVTGRRT